MPDQRQETHAAEVTCPAALPSGCEAYRSSPVSTETTVPPALLHSHCIKPGMWALIHMLEGLLLYRVLAQSRSASSIPRATGVVKAGVPHEVAPLGPVRFQIEFYRMTG